MEIIAPKFGSSRRVAQSKEMDRLRTTTPFFDNYVNEKLQTYRIPPVENISLLEFEQLAASRLRLLKGVEAAAQSYVKGSKEYKSAMDTVVRGSDVLDSRTESATTLEEETIKRRRRDHISHFILRLAFCRTPDLRRWFLQQETELFRFRFNNVETEQGRILFLKCHPHFSSYDMGLLDDENDGDLVETIFHCTTYKSSAVLHKMFYCKVPFFEVPELVRNRKVYLEKGMAYVLKTDLGVIVAGLFRTELSKALVTASKYFGLIQESERLEPFLKRVSNKSYVGKDYGSVDSGSKVRAKDVDALVEESFPLCMRKLHQSLRKSHHLKHGGRMQYGLFLKGIGLSLDEALLFWRNSFAKNVDPEKFDKHYAYNIRHNYGKEGKRKDYTPYSCQKIIMGNPPGPQDCHGCPFRHSDPPLLSQQLESMRLTREEVGKVVGLAKSGHYDQACSRFFEFTHKIPEKSIPQLISHPNGYFEESRKIRSGERKPLPVQEDVSVSEVAAGGGDEMTDEEMLAVLGSTQF